MKGVNSLIIGLFGCLVNNENMGCVALTFSLIRVLEKIAREKGEIYTYYVFEVDPNEESRQLAIEKLNLNENQMKCYDVSPLFKVRRFVHHLPTGIDSLKALQKCDCTIDLTAGDSFTDIYGQYIFDGETNVKLLIKKFGKKLILGPQTYGPFSSEQNIKKAQKAIEQADLVISRDKKSKDYVLNFSKKDVYVTTDLAFDLPYSNEKTLLSSKIKVGINVSGLLIEEKTEKTSLSVKLRTDYCKYIGFVIDWLLEKEMYDVYIIPHVGRDGTDYIKKLYGDKLHYLDAFVDPISAKNVISQMDIFIGARMHATVAAFSSGVATIPTAYSRKFTGLFLNLGYPYTIDLVNDATNENYFKTIEYITDYQKLQEKVRVGMNKVDELSEVTYSLLLEILG